MIAQVQKRLIYLAPLTVSLFIFPLWFGESGIPILSFVANVIIVPVWAAIYSGYKCSYRFASIAFHLLLLVGLVTTTGLIGYCGWGISTGNLHNPDSKTVMIVRDEIRYGVIVSMIVFGLVLYKTKARRVSRA